MGLDDLGPVVDDLELVFLFDERAVAAADVQAVAEVVAARTGGANVEVRQAASRGIAGVQPGYAEQRRRRSGGLVDFGVEDVVAIVSQPEIGQEVRADRVVGADRQTVVGTCGVAAVVVVADAGTAKRAEDLTADQRVGEAAEALEEVDLLVERIVDAFIPGVVVERSAAAGGVVVADASEAAIQRRSNGLGRVRLKEFDRVQPLR